MNNCKNLEKLLKHEREILELIPKNKRESYIEEYGSVMKLNYCRRICSDWVYCENWLGYLRESGY